MKNNDISLEGLVAPATAAAKKIAAYRALLFFLAIMGLYGFIVWRINVFSNAPASVSEEQSQNTTHAQPHIDQTTLTKIKSLQDNSVSVQTLFDSARQNPFQE